MCLHLQGAPEFITIHGSPYSNSSFVQLTGQKARFTGSPGTTYTFELLEDDTISLKALPDVATVTGNTYVTYTAGLMQDQYSNAIQPRTIDRDALQANTVIADRKSGFLNRLDVFDFNTGTLTITFNEPVDDASVNVTFITLQNNTQGAVNYTLTGGTVRYGSLVISPANKRRTLVVSMTTNDLETLKLLLGMLNGVGDTYIDLAAGFASDMAGNPLLATSTALQVR